MQVAQLHLNLRQPQRRSRSKFLVHLAQLQALFDIAVKAQLAAGRRDIQQLALEFALALELVAVELDIDQL
ncbi:hypothetical protein D3C78_1830320 [compost metagenome]